MGIFRGAKNGIADLEREADGLRTRKKLLARQLEVAEVALNEAVTARRTHLLEADLDRTNGQPVKAIVVRLRDEAAAIEDALTTVKSRLVAAEARLMQERDKIGRQQEADKRGEEIDKARAELAELRARNARMAEAMRPLCGIVASMLAALENLERIAPQLLTGIELGLSEGASYVEQILGGNAAIRVEPVPVPQAPPPAPIERRSMLLLQASRWPDPEEPGGARTSGRMTTAMLPVAVAEAAERHGYAIPPDSAQAQRLRTTEPVDYAYNPPSGCTDLTVPPTKPPSTGSGLARKPIVGTATFSRAG
jgi:hypothetical protein